MTSDHFGPHAHLAPEFDVFIAHFGANTIKGRSYTKEIFEQALAILNHHLRGSVRSQNNQYPYIHAAPFLVMYV